MCCGSENLNNCRGMQKFSERLKSSVKILQIPGRRSVPHRSDNTPIGVGAFVGLVL
jgi:hypothetical protein